MERTLGTIAANLQLMRWNKGLSQEQLSRKSGVNRVSIIHIEGGREPSLDTLQRLSEALDCKVADFFDDTDPASLWKINKILNKAADAAREEGDEASLEALYGELNKVTRRMQVFGPYTEATGSKRRRQLQRAHEASQAQAEAKRGDGKRQAPVG